MDLQALEQDILSGIGQAADEAALEAVRVATLGKKGTVSERMKALGGMPPEERKTAGAALNLLKDKAAEAIAARRAALQERALEARLATERIDVTLPARPRPQGTIHPVSQVWEEVVQIWGDLGFSVAEGPHIEDDFHNFTALNMPLEHPARQEHDTFYFNPRPDGSRMVLRTHTSPVQIRTMLSSKPPIRIIAPGRTFRSDSDMTHTPMFNQIEGLVIDETTHLGHLKWALAEFCRAFFENDDVKMRFRASHFPFTEPSMEVDINCSWEGGQVKIGRGSSWLEILGSGMVHPNVIRHGGLDPDRYQGYAFGMGLDRIAMLKYGIPDLRAFFEADLRWLRHYGFRALQVPTLAGGLSWMGSKSAVSNIPLYERDFFAWTIEQAALLREGKLAEADVANIAEEIESMGRSERRELTNRLAVLLEHLLKWQIQRIRRSASWQLTIKEQRIQLAQHLQDNPSLKAHLDDVLRNAFKLARVRAQRATVLNSKVFPDRCQWTIDSVMDDEWFPD